MFVIQNASLPKTEAGSTWNITIGNGEAVHIETHKRDQKSEAHTIDARGALLAPSLCHPHIHIDKAFLLAHPKYASSQKIEAGTFAEAMEMTGKAKAQFDREDLLERGQRVIDESVEAGVTHMRAFVEVDAGVRTKCLEAGLKLRRRAREAGKCVVQLCAFAQLPLWTASPDDDDGKVIRSLMRQAAEQMSEDGAIGSTPYVEDDRAKMEHNVDFMIDLSIEFNCHLDFHLDYNLDSDTEPMVWYVINRLKQKSWGAKTKGRTVVLGHCTRLTLFDTDEWQKLADLIRDADLPISFVGLPTSDLYMMRTEKRPEVRGTLNAPDLIKKYGLNACIGVNNIGNAFTPQGSCDPLSLACQGVGIYEAGTSEDVEILYECVSSRAKAAIGFGKNTSKKDRLTLTQGDSAGLLLFDSVSDSRQSWYRRRSIRDVVYLYDNCRNRRRFFEIEK